MRAAALFLAVGAVLAPGIASADWSTYGRPDIQEEQAWVEQELVLPAFPADADLVPFEVSSTQRAKFFVDGKTFTIGDDGVVRYTVVIKFDGGTSNVMYEGIRCDGEEYKVYAYGNADGTWRPTKNAQWRPVPRVGGHAYQFRLSRDVFCPDFHIVRAREQALRNLGDQGGYGDVDAMERVRRRTW